MCVKCRSRWEEAEKLRPPSVASISWHSNYSPTNVQYDRLLPSRGAFELLGEVTFRSNGSVDGTYESVLLACSLRTSAHDNASSSSPTSSTLVDRWALSSTTPHRVPSGYGKGMMMMRVGRRDTLCKSTGANIRSCRTRERFLLVDLYTSSIVEVHQTSPNTINYAL
jgi:hypothetical protein